MTNTLWNELVVYLQLAQAFQNRLKLPDRDRALILAGSCASLLNLTSVSNYCRHLILNNNQGHMIGKWETFKTAIANDDFQVFLKQIGRRFPLEVAESTLHKLGYQWGLKRSHYNSDNSFLAGILGVEADWLEENFS